MDRFLKANQTVSYCERFRDPGKTCECNDSSKDFSKRSQTLMQQNSLGPGLCWEDSGNVFRGHTRSLCRSTSYWPVVITKTRVTGAFLVFAVRTCCTSLLHWAVPNLRVCAGRVAVPDHSAGWRASNNLWRSCNTDQQPALGPSGHFFRGRRSPVCSSRVTALPHNDVCEEHLITWSCSDGDKQNKKTHTQC